MLGIAAFFSVATAQPATYSVRRSALVPHVAPAPRSGHAPDGQVAIDLSSTTVLMPVQPREAPHANAGLHVARTNLGGGVRMRVGQLDFGPLMEVAPEAGATEINDDFPESPRGPAVGYGAGMHYAAGIDDGFRLGFGLDFLLYRIPFFEQGTCVANCDGYAPSYQERGTHTIGVVSFSLTPSVRRGRWTYFGSVTARNHPSNLKGSVQMSDVADANAEVNGGAMYFLVSAGAELALGGGVSGVLNVFQPITSDPVVYGPAVGAGITVALGRPPVSRPPPPAPSGR